MSTREAPVVDAEQVLLHGGPKAVTRDYLWRGRLCFWQPAKRHGYRFNLDPVLLAGFAPGCPTGHVMDFGAGCGIVGLMLLAQGKAKHVTAVEVQPELAALIAHNAKANGFAAQLDVICGDLRQAALPKVDAVVFNPPYYPKAHFRPCADPGRDQGRRETNGCLADFVGQAMGALAPGAQDGSVSAIVPHARALEMRRLIEAHGGRVRCAQEVWPRATGPAVHMLVTAERAGAAVGTIDPQPPPLILHEGEGRDYTAQINAWVEGPLQVRA